MKTFAKFHWGGHPPHDPPAVPKVYLCDNVAISLFLGMTVPVVAFAAASAFEAHGTNSLREITAACIATVLYLAFCEFWAVPRNRHGFKAKLPTMIACFAPLLLAAVCWSPRSQGVLLLASGCLGTLAGALIMQQVTTIPKRREPTTGPVQRGKHCRIYLRAGFFFLLAIALLLPLGVIPPVMADTAHGSYARTNGIFLGATVVFDLLVALLVGQAVWHTPEPGHLPKATLGIIAFVALFLGLIYCGFAALLSGYGPHLRVASCLLLFCGLCGLITTALMTITSVLVDRARLEKD
jgi:hypothetical protein